MEYIFGTVRRKGVDYENVKTVGSIHSNLKGRCTVRREYPDRTVEDNFTVTDRYFTAEDSEGNCYDWYLIEGHNRDTDTFSPQKPEIDDRAQTMELNLTDTEIYVMEVEQSLTDLEIEVMELKGE